MAQCKDVCPPFEIGKENLMSFDHRGRAFAVYRSADDECFCIDGLSAHEQIQLADGLVMDNIIECPTQNGSFNCRVGEAKGAPVCFDLNTYPAKIENGMVPIQV